MRILTTKLLCSLLAATLQRGPTPTGWASGGRPAQVMTTTRTFMSTGYRPQSLGGFGESELNDWVQAALRLACARLRSRGFRRAISGVALGTDRGEAEAVLDAGLHVVAAMLCREKQSVWSMDVQAHQRSRPDDTT